MHRGRRGCRLVVVGRARVGEFDQEGPWVYSCPHVCSCHLALPDSNTQKGDCTFTIKIRGSLATQAILTQNMLRVVQRARVYFRVPRQVMEVMAIGYISPVSATNVDVFR